MGPFTSIKETQAQNRFARSWCPESTQDRQASPLWGKRKSRSLTPGFGVLSRIMIKRPKYLEYLKAATRRAPITALLGPRQVGKTTLAHVFAGNQSATFFDLESVPAQRQLQNPELVLGNLEGLVILDEIQLMPELFGTLRVLVDRPGQKHGLSSWAVPHRPLFETPQKHWPGGLNL